jgi:methylglyoxal synthase
MILPIAPASSTVSISNYDELYSFISGVLAGDHDITDVFVDGTLKMGGKDYENLVHFLDRLSAVVEEENVNMLLTISCDEADLPEGIHHVAETI